MRDFTVIIFKLGWEFISIINIAIEWFKKTGNNKYTKQRFDKNIFWYWNKVGWQERNNNLDGEFGKCYNGLVLKLHNL